MKSCYCILLVGLIIHARGRTVCAQRGAGWGDTVDTDSGWGERVVAPPRWPDVVHATLVGNRGGQLSLSDVYFDSTSRRHLTITTDQLKGFRLFVDERGRNGTVYAYDGSGAACATLPSHCDLLQADWLSGASYVGARDVDGFQVDCWEQGRAPPPNRPTVAFLTYCAQKSKGREPVRLVLFDGASFDFLKWEPGVKWQQHRPPASSASASASASSHPLASLSARKSDADDDPLPSSCFYRASEAVRQGFGNAGYKGQNLLPWAVTSSGAASAVEQVAGERSSGGGGSVVGAMMAAATASAASSSASAAGRSGKSGSGSGAGGTNIVSTMNNKRLLLGSLAAAVEYQRRMLMDPKLKKKKTKTRTVKLNYKPPAASPPSSASSLP